MSTTIDNGGPAFPVPGMPPVGTGDPRDGMAGGCDSQQGMSLRDYLAAHASEEDVKAYRRKTSDHYGYERYTDTRAGAKYRYADAMIAARNSSCKE